MKDGKNFKIWGVRSDLIGDQIMSLPILNWLEKIQPNSYKYWSVLRKCSQAAPLYFNHPLIDKIVISDFNEGFGPTDEFYRKKCDIIINTRPQHPVEIGWHNLRDMYAETWVMAGLSIGEWNKLSKEEQTPKLFKWFDTTKQEKTIAIHCFAGYGKDKMRGPSENYWKEVIKILIQMGYSVIRLGHANEPEFYFNDYLEIGYNKFYDLRESSLIDQVKISLGCDLYIGTDSGFSLIMGAYNLIPQITLVTNWNIEHKQNFNCLSPNNDKNVTLFELNNCDNIPRDKVIEAIKQLI